MGDLFNSLSTINPWLYYPLILGLILAAGAIGHMLGRKFHEPDDHPRIIDHLGPVQAALTGLLSLMIAFTFSLSLSRYEARRASVLGEATAISDARERAVLLPAPQAAAADRLLSAYVATRIDLGVQAANLSRRQAIIDRSNALQRMLWAQAMAAGGGRSESLPTPAGLFMTALSNLDDRDEERLEADDNQVPLAVFLTLYGLALLVSGYSGYANGHRGSRGLGSNAVLGIAIATVIALIADLDKPGSGLVTVSQQPLINLESMPPPSR